MERTHMNRPGLTEVAAVAGAATALTTAVVVTYSRFPAERFYHVSGHGISGGAGRALVFLNFPLAFVAIAVVAIIASSLLATGSVGERRWFAGAAIVAAALCLVAGWPGVVRQSDLDAKPVNVVPALGVAIVVTLGVIAVRRNGLSRSRAWRGIDTVGAAVGGVLVVLGLPWIFAMVGVYIADVPVLGRLFESNDVTSGQDVLQVHLGDHHGFDGLFLALSALVLARVVGTLRPGWLDRALSWYLAFMFVYGLANMFQDFWGEQIVKRGWSTYEIDSMTVPKISAQYGLIVAATIVVWLLVFHRPATHQPIARRQMLHTS